MLETTSFSVFVSDTCVISAPLEPMLEALKARFDRDPREAVLIFEDGTGRQVDFDLRGTWDEVRARALRSSAADADAIATPPKAGPGRPRLGVVSREISLLPRHWEWLQRQPSGSSAAIRRLVEEARKRDPEGERARLACEAASRFMTAIAGNRAGFEEASRALFAKDAARLEALVADWPKDIRSHLMKLLTP